MSINCPICKKRYAILSLHRQFDCSKCGNPLVAHLKYPTLTFLALASVINGFLALVWLVLSGPVFSQATMINPMLLIIPCVLSTWGLFAWIFNTLTHLSLDRAKLPDGKALRRISGRHYRPETASN